MRLGKYAQHARVGLNFHVKAWCLCIEQGAKGMAKAVLEKQLFAGDSAGRQWDRWKGGQIPSAGEFDVATSAAVSMGWLPREIGNALVKSFSLLRSSDVCADSRSSWDEMAAYDACFQLAELSGKPALVTHCKEWAYWITGPEENSDEFEIWLSEKQLGWAVEEDEILQQTIYQIVEQAMIEVFEQGVVDPVEAFKTNFNMVCKNWPETRAILEEEMSNK